MLKGILLVDVLIVVNPSGISGVIWGVDIDYVDLCLMRIG